MSQRKQTSQTQELIRRLLKHMTQTEISQRTGIPQPRISRWAAGSVSVGADDALKLQALVNAECSRPRKRAKQ